MAKSRRPEAPKGRNDAYTLMLIVTFLAIVTASVLMYLDFDEYGKQKPDGGAPPALTQLGTGATAATQTGPTSGGPTGGGAVTP